MDGSTSLAVYFGHLFYVCMGCRNLTPAFVQLRGQPASLRVVLAVTAWVRSERRFPLYRYWSRSRTATALAPDSVESVFCRWMRSLPRDGGDALRITSSTSSVIRRFALLGDLVVYGWPLLDSGAAFLQCAVVRDAAERTALLEALPPPWTESFPIKATALLCGLLGYFADGLPATAFEAWDRYEALLALLDELPSEQRAVIGPVWCRVYGGRIPVEGPSEIALIELRNFPPDQVWSSSANTNLCSWLVVGNFGFRS